MSYGLYDADLQFYPTPFYNLELMKISSYYKKKREIVSLSPTFSPHLYNHFIVYQDFYYPNNFNTIANNITYGGRAFNGDKYVALPYEIEKQKPDKELYNRVIPNFRNKDLRSTVSIMGRAIHLRLSLDGATIWKDFEKQITYNKRAYGVIFHDYDLGAIQNITTFLKDLITDLPVAKDGNRIGMKFPVQINEPTSLLEWLTFLPLNKYYSLYYNNIIDNDLIYALGEISPAHLGAAQTSINLTNANFQIQDIQKLYRSIINLRSQRIGFPLIYNENAFTEEWKFVLKLISNYNNHIIQKVSKTDYIIRQEPYETLYSYYKNFYKQPKFYNSEELLNIKSAFQFVRENNYELFKDFYEYRGEEVRK